ncbi:MAG: hypothetical protein M1839_008383 [Geoglossum umbratile]|nr:MAG: hypothetical protein M1839_008383 [Geoglossum umbratile]
MDPSSIAAGVIAIIQIADRIVSICRGYLTTVEDAPRDLRNIMMEVGSVKSVLEVLESLAQGQGDDVSLTLETLNSPKGPLEGCREALITLNSLLPAAKCDSADRKRRKTLLSLQSLAWPFQESNALKALDDVRRHKAAISRALTAGYTPDSNPIEAGVGRAKDTFNDGSRESILKWLVVTDPSLDHNEARGLREPDTGRWVARSPVYKCWIGGSINFWWLHGRPGSGKTILASLVVEEVKQFCNSTTLSGIGHAYYYFCYRREQDEVPHFLRWVINQLCRQREHIPIEVHRLRHDGVEPSVSSLLAALSAVLVGFQRVHLVLDALDESTNRENLMEVLLKISTDTSFSKLRILVTSRKELDIERSFSGISTVVSLSHNRWVNDDIRVYIQNRLCHDEKLSRWPEELRAGIETALITGANGGFRWVFCQLDILGRLESPSGIREALGKLPKSLYETYERVLNDIDLENRAYARRALHLLAFDLGIYTVEQLAEAAAVDSDQCTFTTSDQFEDPEVILEICTCLVTYRKTEVNSVRLAHRSVQEYLVSERMKATFFKTSIDAARIRAAKTYITYQLSLDYELLPTTNDYKKCRMLPVHTCDCCWLGGGSLWSKSFPLFHAAFFRWDHIVRGISVRAQGTREYASLLKLIFRLLDPRRPHFQDWIAQWAHGRVLEDRECGVPTWAFLPGTESTATLAYICHFGLDRVAEDFYEQSRDSSILNNQVELLETVSEHRLPGIVCGTPFHISASLNWLKCTEFLISKGADVNSVSPSGWTVLNSALLSAGGCSRAMLRQLLACGANPNPPNMALTPLQSAVHQPWVDSKTVGALLESGSAANAVGCDEAVVAMIRYETRNEVNEDLFQERMLGRGEEFYYDTPLRIVESRLALVSRGNGFKKHYEERSELLVTRRLLLDHGAESLHLPPSDFDLRSKHKREASSDNAESPSVDKALRNLKSPAFQNSLG